jgi:hypothetical protein
MKSKSSSSRKKASASNESREGEILKIPIGTEVIISGARLVVRSFDAKNEIYECYDRKLGTISVKRKFIEEAYVDVLASSTKQVQRAAGNQRFIRSNTSTDEEATFPSS